MKRVLFVFLLFMIIIFSVVPLFAWPTNSFTPAVSENFGAFSPFAGHVFHNGIDIVGTPGSTKCVAIGRMELVYSREDKPGVYNVVFKLLDYGNKYAIFGHITPLSLFDSDHFDFYTLISPEHPLHEGDILPDGKPFAYLASHSSAFTTHNHIHFTVCDDYMLNWKTAVNPLLETYVGENDPNGKSPQIGPVYFKKPPILLADYFHSSTDHGLFGKIRICAEITDNMGGNQATDISPFGNPDNDAWPTPTNRFPGITGSPYKIDWNISDWNSSVRFSDNMTMPTHPDDAPLTRWNGSSFDKKAYNGQVKIYTYTLTSLSANREWNTNLRNTATNWWDATPPARYNGEAMYPDGEYTLAITAKDAADNPSTEKKTTFVLDNFRPLVKEVIVGSAYDGDWGSLITSGAGAVNPFFRLKPLDSRLTGWIGGHDEELEITFSEPIDPGTIRVKIKGTEVHQKGVVVYNPTGSMTWLRILETSTPYSESLRRVF